jgi:hypothetical protein
VQVVAKIQYLCKSPQDDALVELKKLPMQKAVAKGIFYIAAGRSYQSKLMNTAKARALILAYVKLQAVRTWAAGGCPFDGRPAALAVAAAPGPGAAAPGLGAAAPGPGQKIPFVYKTAADADVDVDVDVDEAVDAIADVDEAVDAVVAALPVTKKRKRDPYDAETMQRHSEALSIWPVKYDRKCKRPRRSLRLQLTSQWQHAIVK